jgi:hypothetical protein
MGSMLAVIGGILAFLGAIDLMDAEKMKEIKVLVIKIGGGLLVVGAGLLLDHYGV